MGGLGISSQAILFGAQTWESLWAQEPAGRSRGPHLAYQLVTLQVERAGGRGPRGEGIQHSRGSGPLPGLK